MWYLFIAHRFEQLGAAVNYENDCIVADGLTYYCSISKIVENFVDLSELTLLLLLSWIVLLEVH